MFSAAGVTPHRRATMDADMCRFVTTNHAGFEKAQSGRRKAILGGMRCGNTAVRRQAIHPFSRVGVPGANRRQRAFGRRHEAYNKRLWN
jgi:hypothetical protein